MLRHRFAKCVAKMRSGKVGDVQMLSPTITPGLPERLVEVLVLGTEMEVQSIDVQVTLCLLLWHLVQCGPNDAARGRMQGLSWQCFPLAFLALLRLVEEMRAEGRRPVNYIGLSMSILTDSMVRQLVASILGLPPKPKNRKFPEILEMNSVRKKFICIFCCLQSLPSNY